MEDGSFWYRLSRSQDGQQWLDSNQQPVDSQDILWDPAGPIDENNCAYIQQQKGEENTLRTNNLWSCDDADNAFAFCEFPCN